jgi:hypothetical protein
MSITHSVYVFVVLVIQHAMRMRRVILSSVARPVLPYFATISQKQARFKNKLKVIDHKMRVLILSTTLV